MMFGERTMLCIAPGKAERNTFSQTLEKLPIGIGSADLHELIGLTHSKASPVIASILLSTN